MDSLTRPFATALMGVLLASHLSAQDQAKPIEPANLDTTCAPCQNFFQNSPGYW